MRIGINCRSFLNQRSAGIGRYAQHLVKSLSDVDVVNDYFLYVRRNLFDLRKKIPRVPARNFQTKVDWFKQGITKTLPEIDIYHAPSPETLDIDGCKIIVTMHDLIYKAFPQGHTEATIATTNQQFQGIVERADKIICCSEYTKKDLLKYFPMDQNKIAMIHQGVDKNVFYPVSSDERPAARAAIRAKGVTGPFILFVGTIEPRKNLKNLLKAFALIKKEFQGSLAVVGMKGWMSDDIGALVEELNLKNNVHLLGYLTDEELRYFYNEAEVFVFPSFYEGFGFPIVEAFSCGAPVVTSNASSCPEVAAEAALLIDPTNVQDMVDKILRVMRDRTLRNSLKEKGLKRATDFSFEKTARETLAVYRNVYEN